MPKQLRNRKLKEERSAPYRVEPSTTRRFFFEEEHLLEGEDAIENLYRDARKTCTGVMEPRKNWALYGDQYKMENLYFINQQFGKSTGFDKRLVLKERLANGEVRIASDVSGIAIEAKLFKKEHTLHAVPPMISRAKRQLPSVQIMKGKNEPDESIVLNGRVKLRLRINAVSSQFGNRPFVIRLQSKGGNPEDMNFKPFHFQPIFVRSKYPRFMRAKKSREVSGSGACPQKREKALVLKSTAGAPALCLPASIKKEPFWSFNPAFKKAFGGRSISKVKINVGRPAAESAAAPLASADISTLLESAFPLERVCSTSSVKSLGSFDLDYDFLSPRLHFADGEDSMAEVKVDVEFGEDPFSSSTALTDDEEDDLFAASDDWIQKSSFGNDDLMGFDFGPLPGIDFFD
jgi:hypothetical protein